MLAAFIEPKFSQFDNHSHMYWYKQQHFLVSLLTLLPPSSKHLTENLVLFIKSTNKVKVLAHLIS